MRLKIIVPVIAALALLSPPAIADFGQSPMLAKEVADGKLPPVTDRLPQPPRVIDIEGGQYGGDLRIAMARARDTRLMTVYGYARLVGYDDDYNLVPDILESFEAVDDKVFTFKLRKGRPGPDRGEGPRGARRPGCDLGGQPGLDGIAVPARRGVEGWSDGRTRHI